MQKLMLGFLLSLGLIVSSFANEIDLISLATNGAYNEQSKGVKVLNDEEMSEVVGGFAQGNVIKKYSITNNFGQKIYTKTYCANLSAQDKPYFNLLPNEIAGIEYIENHRTGTKERNIVAIDTRNFTYMRNLSSNLWNRYGKR